jgi:hypothetical protein
MAVIRRSRSITPVTLDRGAQPNVRLPGATHTPVGNTVGQRAANVNCRATGVQCADMCNECDLLRRTVGPCCRTVASCRRCRYQMVCGVRPRVADVDPAVPGRGAIALDRYRDLPLPRIPGRMADQVDKYLVDNRDEVPGVHLDPRKRLPSCQDFRRARTRIRRFVCRPLGVRASHAPADRTVRRTDAGQGSEVHAESRGRWSGSLSIHSGEGNLPTRKRVNPAFRAAWRGALCY